MIRICAWCKAWLGQKEPLEDKRVTHGICQECLDRSFLPVREDEDGDRSPTAQVSSGVPDL